MTVRSYNKQAMIAELRAHALTSVTPARLGHEGARTPGAKGVLLMLNHLEKNTDFFDAPASSRRHYHKSEVGGLAQHSWNVIKLMQRFIVATFNDTAQAELYWSATPTAAALDTKALLESCFVIGLCHDLNKTTVWGHRQYVDNMLVKGRSEAEPWKKNAQRVKLGSTDQVLLASEFIDLKADEVQGIRYIEGMYDRSFMADLGANFEFLTLAAHHADIMASHVVESNVPWDRDHRTWGAQFGAYASVPQTAEEAAIL